MKLASVKYDPTSENWYSTEYLPDTPRSILVYTVEGGTAEGYYNPVSEKWFHFRWNCFITPTYWREMPRYESKNSL